MNVGVLGSGDVAKALAGGFMQHGHPMRMGTRTTAKLSDWPANDPKAFFTNLDESLMERLQLEFPDANFAKAFNSVGDATVVNPRFQGGKPAMFLCGKSETAEKSVRKIRDEFGWEAVDMGSAEAARAIELLCMLWCVPGFLRD